MNRAERRALAKRVVRRDTSGAKTRVARSLFARSLREAPAAPEADPTPGDLGLEVVTADQLLWTPNKEAK